MRHLDAEVANIPRSQSGSTQTGQSWTASSDFSQQVAASSGTRLQAPRAAAGRATLAGRASRWLSAQVVYSVNGAVVARARQSVTTLTSAGLPAAIAARRAPAPGGCRRASRRTRRSRRAPRPSCRSGCSRDRGPAWSRSGSAVQPPFRLITTSTGSLWRTAVSSSIAFMPNEPSPCSTTTCLSGLRDLGADPERQAHAHGAERARSSAGGRARRSGSTGGRSSGSPGRRPRGSRRGR